jgi:hypothetical protein
MRPGTSETARSLVIRGTSVRTLKAVAFIGLAGCTIGLVVFIAGLAGPVDARGNYVGGDFLVFYTAGRMVLEGKAASLYDLHEQLSMVRRIVGQGDYDNLLPYVNPPILALAFAPLSALPYRLGYAISVLLLATVLWGGLRALRGVLPSLAGDWFVVVALSLLFYPCARTITGGQNMALTFTLMAVAYAALRRGRNTTAGVALGLLCYKPHFVLVFSTLLLSRRCWTCLASAAAVGLCQYAIGALLCGLRWPLDMLNCVKAYWPMECKHNGPFLISWVGFLEHAVGPAVGKPLGYGLALITLAAVLWAWRRFDGKGVSSGPLWGMAVCATILVSPHTQWYDGGLVLLPVLLGIDSCLRQDLAIGVPSRAVLAAGFLLFPLYRLAPTLGWNPLIVLPVCVLIWMARLARLGGKMSVR